MAVQGSTKKWMFIGSGVIVAGALVVLFQNYPPQPKDAAGAIGAAQRYHEPQITGADVKVSQDELTTWIQSETFDRIVKDPQARKLFTDAAVADVLSDAGMKRQITAPDAPLDRVRTVEFAVNLDQAKLLAPGFDLATAKKMIAVVEGNGPDGMQKKLHLSLEPDDADRLQRVLADVGGGGDGIRNKPNFQLDTDFLQRVNYSLDRVRLIELADSNAAILAAFDDSAFVKAFAEDTSLADGLVHYARRVDTTGEPK